MPHPYASTPPLSKYVPLVAYLAAREDDTVTLSLAQIETIIGVPLSDSAHVSLSLWSGTAGRLGRDLRTIGWRARLHVQGRAVEFRRVAGAREG